MSDGLCAWKIIVRIIINGGFCKDSMNRILIWGTGKFIETYSGEIKTIFEKKDYELLAFVDNNPEKTGKSIMGKIVISSSDVKGMQFDEIVIATSKFSYNGIKKQIMEDLGIPKESIHSFTWLITKANDNSEGADQTKSDVKVFDCFPFYNELDILQFRLELLDPYVDYFVLSEIPQTHRWEDKPLYFKENEGMFEKYLDKILYVSSDTLPPKPLDPYLNWTLENYQRNCVALSLKEYAKRDDLVMVSDVDEIPNPEVIMRIKDSEWMVESDVYSFEQEFYYYYFDFCHKNKWNGTFITKYKNLGMPQTWRNICGDLPELKGGGWHLSYFGGTDRIGRKIESTVDSAEFKVSPGQIRERILAGKDIFGREGVEFDILRTDLDSIEGIDINSVKTKYPQFFLEEDNVDE